MGKLQRVSKDVVVRKNYQRNEFKFLEFRYLRRELIHFDNVNFSYYIHYKFINWFKLSMSLSRIRNLCIKTGRARWIVRRFLLSRISFKEYMRLGKLQGMRKM